MDAHLHKKEDIEECTVCAHPCHTDAPCGLCNIPHPDKAGYLLCSCCGEGHALVGPDSAGCGVVGCLDFNEDCILADVAKDCINGHPCNGHMGCTVDGCEGNLLAVMQEQFDARDGPLEKTEEDILDAEAWCGMMGAEDNSLTVFTGSQAWDNELATWKTGRESSKSSKKGGKKDYGKYQTSHNTGGGTYTHKSCTHTGEARKVGPHTILLGGTRNLKSSDYDKADILIPLLDSGWPSFGWGKKYVLIPMPLTDYGGVPANWEETLKNTIVPLLKEKKKILAFCMGSHGRTGCFYASLISLLEPETADPIEAARERHCKHAVETEAQAKAVFACRGEELPEKYKEEFKKVYTAYQGSTYSSQNTPDPSKMIINGTTYYKHPDNTWRDDQPLEQYFFVTPRVGARSMWTAKVFVDDKVHHAMWATSEKDAQARFETAGGVGDAPPTQVVGSSESQNPLGCKEGDVCFGIFYNKGADIPSSFSVEGTPGYKDLLAAGKIMLVEMESRYSGKPDKVPLFTDWTTACAIRKHLDTQQAYYTTNVVIRVLAKTPEKKEVKQLPAPKASPVKWDLLLGCAYIFADENGEFEAEFQGRTAAGDLRLIFQKSGVVFVLGEDELKSAALLDAPAKEDKT